jgi:hypothetical protein
MLYWPLRTNPDRPPPPGSGIICTSSTSSTSTIIISTIITVVTIAPAPTAIAHGSGVVIVAEVVEGSKRGVVEIHDYHIVLSDAFSTITFSTAPATATATSFVLLLAGLLWRYRLEVTWYRTQSGSDHTHRGRHDTRSRWCSSLGTFASRHVRQREREKVASSAAAATAATDIITTPVCRLLFFGLFLP